VTLFLLMVALAGAMTLNSILRMLRSRFIQPVDLAVLAVFYYTVPLAVAGYFIYNPRNLIFLHPQAGDPAIAMQSMRYALVAILALYGGQWAASRLGAPRLGTYFKLEHGGVTRAWLAIGAMVAIIWFGVIQFGFSEFMQGYLTEADLEGGTLGTALVYFGVGSLGLVGVYAILLNKFLARRDVWLIVGVTFAVCVVVLLIRSKRLEIVTTFLPVAIVLLASRSTIKAVSWRLFLGVGLLVLLVLVALIRVNDEFELFTINYYFLSEGLYAGHAMPGIIHRLDSGMLGYENGMRFVTAILAFLPRFIWEGKDDVVYAGNLALEGVAPLGATTFLAETVLQGGLIAVVLVHLIMGFVFERVSRFEAVWDAAIASGRIPGRFILYLAFTAILIPHFRDGIIPAVKLTLQACVFFVILTGLHWTPAYLLQRRSVVEKGAAAPL